MSFHPVPALSQGLFGSPTQAPASMRRSPLFSLRPAGAWNSGGRRPKKQNSVGAACAPHTHTTGLQARGSKTGRVLRIFPRVRVSSLQTPDQLASLF